MVFHRSKYFVQHRFAPFQQVLESRLKVTGVPGVGNVAADSGVGHHQVNLPLGVCGNDAPKEPEVGSVHADDPLEAVVIGPGDLPGAFVRVEPHSVLT